MDAKDDKEKVAEHDAAKENSNSPAEPVAESSSCCNNKDITSVIQIDAGPVPDSDRSQTNVEEVVAEQSSHQPVASPSNENVQDCCISVPESAYPHPSRDRIVGLIHPKGYINGLVRSEDLNLRNSRHPGLGDVTLNLTEFLSYAQRNNYDIVIPASRENRAVNTNLPRIGSGRGYMVLEQQPLGRDFGAATTAAYPASDFISISNVPSRNSVLAPNMYHTPEDIQPPAVDFSAPPPYEMPLKLPTYEEVQREKALEGEMMPPNLDIQNPDVSSPRTLSFLAIDADMGANADPESKLLGTDFMFAVSFFLALVFNWIGFLLLMCFCHTVASRYGALSGFGLSLAKWTIIVKNSTEVPVHNAWLWWLITAFGLLICVRSLFQYINIKRGWRLMSAATQERLLFFY